jgi:hypothetical protein
MESLPLPARDEQYNCACCHDAGYLPSPFPAFPGDYVLCPCCHTDWRWTTVEPPRPRRLSVRELRRRVARMLERQPDVPESPETPW